MREGIWGVRERPSGATISIPEPTNLLDSARGKSPQVNAENGKHGGERTVCVCGMERRVCVMKKLCVEEVLMSGRGVWKGKVGCTTITTPFVQSRLFVSTWL